MSSELDSRDMRASLAVWVGRALSGALVAFMLGASVAPKLFLPHVSEPAMAELGWPSKLTPLVGIIELVGTLLYAVPRTSTLGALVLTGLFGGAIAMQMRIDSPLFSHILFGTYLGCVMWLGLWLRSPQLRTVLPLVRR